MLVLHHACFPSTRARDDALTAEKHPRVTAWWKTIQARPAFARADIGPFVD